MAYVDFSADPILAAYPDRSHAENAAPAPTGLTALEWSVVALAKRDRMSSLAKPGRIAMALSSLFGDGSAGRHLADPRLEALRRMAVLSWHRGFSVPSAELKAFLSAGFSLDQYETMLTSIGMDRPRREARA
jgi:hypothetical protein